MSPSSFPKKSGYRYERNLPSEETLSLIAVHNWLKANSRLLFLGIAVALIMGAVAEKSYKHFLHHEFVPVLSPEFIVEDIFMVIFFAGVMLESRRPLLPGGELSGNRRWVLPFATAIGGVIVPASFVFFGPWSEEIREAWAIPTATDIVICLVAIRFVLGRFSQVRDIIGLLAIIDDIIGILIILLAFSGGLTDRLWWLLVPAGVLIFTWRVLNKRMSVTDYRWYLPLIIPAWFGLYQAGAHPALAGGAVVYGISFDPKTVHMAVEKYHHLRHNGLCGPNALLDLEHALRVPIEYVLFFFGATAAVINLTAPEFSTLTVVVCLALLLGKPVGVMLGTLFAIKVVKAKLPEGMDMKQMFIGGQLAGIGMTVAIFVSNQTYTDETLLEAAKLGAFLSVFAIMIAEITRRVLRVPRATLEPKRSFAHHSHELESVDVSPEDFGEHDVEDRESQEVLLRGSVL